MPKITTLAVIAAGLFAPDQPELPIGLTLDAPSNVAEKLIAEGSAQLAGDDVPYSELPAAAEPTKAEKATKSAQARLLVDCIHGKTNDLVVLPASIAKQLEKDGQADTDKAAVAYAQSLPQNQAKA